MEKKIDLLVSVSGKNNEVVEKDTILFLWTLKDKCSLDNMNVFVVFRDCMPVTANLKKLVEGFEWIHTTVCPLTELDVCREDTSAVTNWMVDNVGQSPWICVSHFDIEFHGDYFAWLLQMIDSGAVMVGRHHDGICTINRAAYKSCGVGFNGVDHFRVKTNINNEYYIVSALHPRCDFNSRNGFCLSLDVGELLELRVATLKWTHIWHRKGDDIGKSELFTHHRSGSRSVVEPRVTLTHNRQYKEITEKAYSMITTLGGDMVIHLTYLPNGLDEGIGDRWRIACMSHVTDFSTTAHHPNYLRSNDTRAVTCSACKATAIFREVRTKERP